MTKSGWSLLGVFYLGQGRFEELWGHQSKKHRTSKYCSREIPEMKMPEPPSGKCYKLDDKHLDEYEELFGGPSDVVIPFPTPWISSDATH